MTICMKCQILFSGKNKKNIIFGRLNWPKKLRVVGSGKGVMYLTTPGCPTEIGLQLGKACYPCSRLG